MDDASRQRSWESAMRSLVRRINVGWWLQCWVPLLLGCSFALSLIILAVRTLSPSLGTNLVICAGAMVLLSALVAWWRARSWFETREQARVRLEDALGLHTQLSAAELGVAPWPPVPAALPAPVVWKPERAVGLIALSLLVMVAALLVPTSTLAKSRPKVIEKPGAVTQVEEWLEQLKEDDAVNSKNIDDVEKQIEELIHRPQDQWYEHASLEAAEHLKNETGKALQELGAQMEQSRNSLAALAAAGSLASEKARQAAEKAAENLNGLRSGAMNAGRDLSEQLNDIDANALQGMSQEQLKELAERLKQNADALREALANAPQFDFKECAQCLSKDGEGEGEQPGQGGVGRGKGDAGLTVRQDETHLGSKRAEDLSAMLDPERIAPGDLIGTSDGKQKVDESAYGGPAAGGSAGIGEGGAAVWQAPLLPSERAVLKRYFK
jgi:hypothetical protein